MAGATPAQGDTGRLVTRIPGGWGGGRCRIRVIDTFGTEPAYNHEEYATLHGYRTNWGYWNLNPKQFMTMFRECPAAPWSGAGWGGPLPGVGRRQVPFCPLLSSFGGLCEDRDASNHRSWLRKPGSPLSKGVNHKGSLWWCVCGEGWPGVGVGWRGGLFNTWRMQPLSSWSTGCSQRAAEHRGPDQTGFCGLPETFQSDGDLMSGEGQHSEAF